MLNINDEITALEVKIDILKEDGKFEAAKIACFQAAKLGSGNICMLLATAYHPGGKIFPEQFQTMFIKNRRRANRFCNRELKCLRKSAKKVIISLCLAYTMLIVSAILDLCVNLGFYEPNYGFVKPLNLDMKFL